MLCSSIREKKRDTSLGTSDCLGSIDFRGDLQTSFVFCYAMFTFQERSGSALGIADSVAARAGPFWPGKQKHMYPVPWFGTDLVTG